MGWEEGMSAELAELRKHIDGRFDRLEDRVEEYSKEQGVHAVAIATIEQRHETEKETRHERWDNMHGIIGKIQVDAAETKKDVTDLKNARNRFIAFVSGVSATVSAGVSWLVKGSPGA
jgi:hypothetical protein